MHNTNPPRYRARRTAADLWIFNTNDTAILMVAAVLLLLAAIVHVL